MSYWRLFYHATWSTKERLSLIESAWEVNLHNVTAAKATALRAHVYAVGGIEDHIHLVASIPPSIALSKFVGQVKGNSKVVSVLKYSPLSTAVETACHLYEAALRRLCSFEIQTINAN